STGSTARITDSGKYDKGVIDQWNVSNSNAAIIQGGGHKNDAAISQTGGWHASSDLLTASITQNGSHNKAVAEQTGRSNDSNIIQSGLGNDAYNSQSGAGNDSYISQGGAYNKAVVTQAGYNL